jgi:hypothetical protein
LSAEDDVRLRDLLNGFQASEALHAAAELGVPDALADGSLSLEGLASTTRTLPDPLSRLLRVLEVVGVLERDAESRYGLSAMGQRLRSDLEGNWNAWARMIGSPAIRRSWGQLTEAIRAGTTGFELAHGSDIWTYRSQHRQDGALFDAAMRGGTERLAAPVAECLGNLDGLHVVDVGGGDGSLLAHLLLAHPGATGTLLEQGAPATRARGLLGRHGLLHRARIIEGDFFLDVPTDGDLYLLKFVLHDWDDGRAACILRSCRTAIQTSGDCACLVLIERLLDAPIGALEASLADLNMLVNTGGRERTRQEYEHLLQRAGFELSRCEAASGSLTVMRARPW